MHLRFLKSPRLGFLSALGLISLLTGCRDEDIAIYSVPKEAVQSTSSADGSPAVPHLHYDTPPGWEEQGPSRMRMVGFKIAGTNGQQADVAVTPMALLTIAKTNLVNMWREQAKLPPLSEAEVDKVVEPVRVGDAQGEMFDLVSNDSLIDEKYPLRILVAMVNRDGLSWFFKVSGASDLVAAERPHFLQFLQSVKFDLEDHVAAPRMASTNTKSIPAPDPSRPEWKTPPGWKEQPPTAFSLARFATSNPESGKAEVTVSVFPGSAGSRLENVNRWRTQLGLAKISAAELTEVAKPLDATTPDAILVDLTGTDVKGGSDRPTRTVAAMVTQPGRTWVYKLMGDEPVVGREKPAFIEFIQSARYAHDP